MKIGIAVFAFCRYMHLEKVLEGLHKNEGVEHLYIFQDGKTKDCSQEGWEKTNELIRTIDWCQTEFVVSQQNRGLAKSIVFGINYVLRENEAVIVLEDDCVPHMNYISFMRQNLSRYSNVKEVYSISGHSWPIGLMQGDSDIYFCGRFSSWGWGTWKDRWQVYEEDYTLLRKIKQNKEASERLATWGTDLENMLLGNVEGKNDSWAVFWTLKIIENNGVCINPYVPLIQNIGCDGSGFHCATRTKQGKLWNGDLKLIRWPQNIGYLEETKRKFCSLYGSRIALAQKKELPKVLIYGLGNFYLRNEDFLLKKYNIVGYIDRCKKGYYAGKKIYQSKMINELEYNYIIVMIQNLAECMTITRTLIHTNKISSKSIKLGYHAIDCIDGFVENIQFSEEGIFCLNFAGTQIEVHSIDELNNVREVWKNKSYQYCLANGKKDIIFDVGMNIGDATLFFLKNSNVEKVYGFEPFLSTYSNARDNLKNNGYEHSDRVEIMNIGLSNVDEKRTITFNCNMTCGQSTIRTVNDIAYQKYSDISLIREADNENVDITVRKSSDVFATLIKQHQNRNIVLKIDCEGEEYSIFRDLDENGVLQSIDFIMLEWHYQGKEELIEILRKNYFTYWCVDKSLEMGMIYAKKNG